MAKVMKLLGVLFLVWIQTSHTDAQVVLTSSLGDLPYACPGEVVVYTCRVESGPNLIWTAPPYVPEDSQIAFFLDERTSDAKSQGGICSFLTDLSRENNMSTIANYTSKLNFDNFNNIPSTTITCTDGLNQTSLQYRLSEDSDIRPPQNINVRMIVFGTDFDEQLHLEHTIAEISWELPEDIEAFRFDGYFVRVSNSRTSEVIEFPLDENATSTRVPLLYGFVNFEVRTRDICGDMSQPMNMTMDVENRVSPVAIGLIVVVVIVALVVLSLIIAVVVLCCRLCIKRNRAALDGKRPSEKKKSTIETMDLIASGGEPGSKFPIQETRETNFTSVVTTKKK